MGRQSMTCAGGLSLLIGILAWPIATPAQGFCYMVNASGELVNLDDLCLGDSAPAAPVPQGADNGTAADRPVSPTRFTVVGPLNGGSDSAADNAPASAAESPDDEPAATPSTPDTAPAAETSADPAPSDRLAIPQRDIPVPDIAVPEIPQPATGETAP